MKRIALGPAVALLVAAAGARGGYEPYYPTKAKVAAEGDPQRAAVTFLSWDTAGGERVRTNLLRKGSHVGLRVKVGGQWRNCSDMTAQVRKRANGVSYDVPVGGADVHWAVTAVDDRIEIAVTASGDARGIEAMDMHVPFDPGVTPTTVLPHAFKDDGAMELPAVVVAPDFGAMGMKDTGGMVKGMRLLGDRGGHRTTLVVEFVVPADGKAVRLELTPVWPRKPEGMKDGAMWARAARGWLSALQPSAQWGDQKNPFSAPAGMLGNNVISDPASSSLWFYADQAFFTPEITDAVSAMALVRRTVEWWLDHRMRPTGEMVCYWDYTNFLDANAGPVIAAWDYVEATGDQEWLKARVGQLEKVADFVASRDVDHDGLIEATQPGTPNSLQQPGRSDAWWDALNCGHKDAYTNALIYRALRCLADLEGKLGRAEQQSRYAKLADALKATYYKTLYNPATGCVAWWKDRDGKFHDFWSPTVNGMAIEYGLVPPDEGRRILGVIRQKMKDVGFTRPDLGVPPQLVPVPRADYLQPNAPGLAKKEDGSDAFQQYMNGGITAGQTLHWMMAHYVVGEPGPADEVLIAMLGREDKGLFQNGVRDVGGQGIDWDDLGRQAVRVRGLPGRFVPLPAGRRDARGADARKTVQADAVAGAG